MAYANKSFISPTQVMATTNRRKPQSICSWEGFESERAAIRKRAEEVRDSDLALRNSGMNSAEATGRILMGVRDMSTATDPLVRRAAQAQLDLRSFQSDLVSNKGLDWDFVYCESSEILDPSEHNKANCARIMSVTLARHNKPKRKKTKTTKK